MALRVLVSLLLLCVSWALYVDALAPVDAQRVNSWLRARAYEAKSADPMHQRVFERPKFPVHYFEQPIDHFSNKTTTETFGQRYWVNSQHYAPGGPVIVLDGGETAGEGEKMEYLLHRWNMFLESFCIVQCLVIVCRPPAFPRLWHRRHPGRGDQRARDRAGTQILRLVSTYDGYMAVFDIFSL
jgi:hypothetical protein